MAVVTLADYLPRMGIESPPAEDQRGVAVDPIAEAVAATRREVEAEYEARIAALREEHAAALEAGLDEARRHWVAGEAEHLSARIPAALDTLEASIGDATARVLLPFLATAARRLAVDDLVTSIRHLFRNAGTAAVRVAGPADLLGAIEDRLGELSSAVEFVVDDAVDVTVCADRTLIATQIGAWVDRLWKQEAEAHG